MQSCFAFQAPCCRKFSAMNQSQQSPSCCKHSSQGRLSSPEHNKLHKSPCICCPMCLSICSIIGSTIQLTVACCLIKVVAFISAFALLTSTAVASAALLSMLLKVLSGAERRRLGLPCASATYILPETCLSCCRSHLFGSCLCLLHFKYPAGNDAAHHRVCCWGKLLQGPPHQAFREDACG